MSAKRVKVEETVETHCPECGKATAHAVIAGLNGGSGRVKCLTCGDIRAREAGDGGKEAEEMEDTEGFGNEAAEEEEEEEEEEPLTAGAEAEEEVAEGHLALGKDAAAEEPVHEDEDEEAGIARMRSGLIEEPDEVEAAEEDEDEDEEEEGDQEGDDDEARGLSSFGRSSFEEGVAEVVDEDEEGNAPKKKKKKRAIRKKPASPRAHASSASWDDVMVHADEKKARSYSLRETYRAEELVRHAKFGIGKVIEVLSAQKINVLFKEGCKMMLQGQGQR